MSKPTTRRALLAGAAVGALAGQQPPQEFVRLPQRVRIGLIGLDGHFNEIVKPLPRVPDAELVAVADPDPAALAPFRTAHCYTDYREMLDREKLDVVGICNTNGERAAAILACLERKLHVAAEKPLGIEMEDFLRVKQAVASSGARLTMLLPMRFDPSYVALRQIAESGEIGEVVQVTAQKSYKAGRRPGWYKRRTTYGGTIAWIGIHMIDLMRWTSRREFTEAVSFQTRIGFPELGEMENVTGTLFRLDNGGVASLTMDYLRPGTASTHGDDRLRLAGLKGVLEYSDSAGISLMTGSRPPRAIVERPPARSLFIEFLQSIYRGTPPSLTLDDIYRVNQIALLARDSAERRELVKL